MSFIGTLLVAVSTLMHASWNLVAKRSRATVAFLFVGNGLGALALLPFGLWGVHEGLMQGLWPFVAGSGLALAVYFAALGLAYEHGDMSVVYPLIRAVPVVIIAGVEHFSGKESISPPALFGMLLVTVGCLALGMDQGRKADSRPGRKFSVFGMAVMAAAVLATVAFSLIDKAGMSRAGGGAAAFVYAYWEFVFTAAFLLPPALISASERANFRELKTQKTAVIAFTVLNLLTYGLVLWGMQSCKISYLVAFRQLSIVVGVILAGLILKEARFRRRLLLSLAILAGIILVGTGDALWAAWLKQTSE
ncbi:MAG: EamA family transporter [Planctomycetes bacterium]|nr:EamA family transporter [Planctomycetota bacterium]